MIVKVDKVFVAMEKRKVILDAERSNNHVNRFADGYPAFPQEAEIIGALQCNGCIENVQYG
jgi:hypothetical protein